MANENRLQGVMDLHIHAYPDVRKRRLDDIDLMEAAVERGVRAIVLKNHQSSTAERAIIANKIAQERHPGTDFQAFGGICLNRTVGGINPSAVEVCLKLGGKIVWMPTLTAENHCKKKGKSTENAVAVVKNGEVVPELYDVFDLINKYDAALATGHISPAECFIVAKAAREAGVKKIIVTHPEFWIVGMSLDDQEKIVREYDVLLEHVYRQPLPDGTYIENLETNAEAMHKIGCEHFIVSTDSGQTENPFWYDGYLKYINYLYDVAGFSKEEVDVMTKTNPGRMLGIVK